MTEGNGHVIDPNGDARRALQEAVAEHGPEVLSNAAVMDNVCRDHLAGLPGESILIGDAARTNVPALLSDLIPQLGNYGAIQSAAAALAGEHNLDMAASLWVVREFARALGYIAPATGTSPSFPGSGPRPVPGSGPRPVPGSGLATGAGPAESPAGIGGVTGAAKGSGTAGAGSEGGASARPSGEAGRGVAEGAAAGAAAAAAAGIAGAGVAGAGIAADEAGRHESASSEAATSGPRTRRPGASGPGASGAFDDGAAGASGAGASGAGASGAGASGAGGGSASGASGTRAGGETGEASGGPGATAAASGGLGATGPASGGLGATGAAGGGPGATGPIGGSSQVSTGPVGNVPGAGSPLAGGVWGGPAAPGGTSGSGTSGSGTSGSGTSGSGTGGDGSRGRAPGGAAPEGDPGFPLPLPAGRLPGRQSQRSTLLNRNTVGIAAAIALIAGYLGVAAVAHLSPFPAKAVATPSTSQSSSAPARSSPASSPDPSADPSPPSQLDILLTKIPPAVRSAGQCLNAGTGSGATAVIQCQKLQGLAANVIVYYEYPNRTALASGFSAFLKKQKFKKAKECTTNGVFSDFIVECESDFTIKTPGMTGSIAEYAALTASMNPVIVSTDNEQNVMAVMVGANDGDLLKYWNQLKWVVTP